MGISLFVLGVTGNIATGKTTAALTAKKQLHAIYIDADKISHRLIRPYSPCWEKIVKTFGKDILTKNKAINRSILGALVFSDTKKKKALEEILHPAILKDIKSSLNTVKKKIPDSFVVLEATLLLDSDLLNLTNEIWIIEAEKEKQIERLIKERGCTMKKALTRVSSYSISEEKKEHEKVKHIISNNFDSQKLKNKIISLCKNLKKEQEK